MVASLNGVIFDQIYGDNSGGAEFDTDSDGTATQEDEFVSFTNTTGAPIDISGWQIWSDSTGTGGPDNPQDGLYHTFPPGTVLQPGETLYIINEISEAPRSWAQESSEGGTESGAGGENTNYLSDGGGTTSESIALVNPATGEFLVFNMDDDPSDFSEFDGGGTGSNSSLAGFPGTTMVAEIDGASVQQDMAAGSSYQYNSSTDSYEYSTVYVPCLVAGTLIETPTGARRIETLKPHDIVLTYDGGRARVRMVLHRNVGLTPHAATGEHPVLIAPGALQPGVPQTALCLSQQHRVLVDLPDGTQALCPAKGLLDRPCIRIKRGARRVTYYHLLLDRHEVIVANGAPVESMYPGDYGVSRLPPGTRAWLDRSGLLSGRPRAARPLIGPSAYRRLMRDNAWPAAPSMY